MVDCKPNPFIKHGFDRSSSHNEDRYVCTCENRVYDPNGNLESELRDTLNYYTTFGVYDEHQLDTLTNLINSVIWEIGHGDEESSSETCEDI